MAREHLQAACLEHAAILFPKAELSLLKHQGGCSLTMLVTFPGAGAIPGRRVLQFRPRRFSLDMHIAQAACMVHEGLVPSTIEHAWLPLNQECLQVLEMPLLSGTRFSDIQPRKGSLDDVMISKLERLMLGLADTFATSWHRRDHSKNPLGRIGTSLISRLRRLALCLPEYELSRRTQAVLNRVEAGELETLPVVLTHGDLLPSNVLVNAKAWSIEGIIDWAEAEYLPFGMALYAIEHLLGIVDRRPGQDSSFVYYTQAAQLRYLFWSRLVQAVPELADPVLLLATLLARDVGVLLWHGFAWDDGKLERIVDAQSDAEEIAHLRAFLSCGNDIPCKL